MAFFAPWYSESSYLSPIPFILVYKFHVIYYIYLPSINLKIFSPINIAISNIKMDLREIGLYGMDWIDLAQDRDQWRALVNTVM
jgi:hypothetical protein